MTDIHFLVSKKKERGAQGGGWPQPSNDLFNTVKEMTQGQRSKAFSPAKEKKKERETIEPP